MHLFYYHCSLKSSKHFSVRYNSATFFALIAFVYKFFISTFLAKTLWKIALLTKILKYGTRSDLIYDSTRPRNTLLHLNRPHRARTALTLIPHYFHQTALKQCGIVLSATPLMRAFNNASRCV